MINDDLAMKGCLTIELKGPDGELKDSRDITNVVTGDGKEWVAQRMGKANADLPALMSDMAIGTSTQGPDPTDTALYTERNRQSLSSTTVSADSNEVVYSASFGSNQPDAPYPITEAGIFNSNSGGVMLCRTKFNAINKGTGDTLNITWTVEAS